MPSPESQLSLLCLLKHKWRYENAYWTRRRQCARCGKRQSWTCIGWKVPIRWMEGGDR